MIPPPRGSAPSSPSQVISSPTQTPPQGSAPPSQSLPMASLSDQTPPRGSAPSSPSQVTASLSETAPPGLAPPSPSLPPAPLSPTTPRGSAPSSQSQVTAALSQTAPRGSAPPSPSLQQRPRTRDETKMKQWAELVKRCHEVIALLIGFALIFAPIGFIIKALGVYGAQALPVKKIIVSILLDFQIHLVYPFLSVGLAYGLLYVLSSSAIPVAWALWMDAFSVVAGFSNLFVVIYYISWEVSIIGGIACTLVILVLLCFQFPRKRVVARDVERL